MGGGKLKNITLSKSSSHRQRIVITESAKKIKEGFKAQMHEFMIMHWDSKVIKYEHHHQTDDRLGVVYPTDEGKTKNQFMAAPRIPDSSGKSMQEALTAVIDAWEINDENILGMCWDTTASNTGVRQGSASLFELVLQRPMLWITCRHHIGELHISHSDEEVRGTWDGEPLSKKQ